MGTAKAAKGGAEAERDGTERTSGRTQSEGNVPRVWAASSKSVTSTELVSCKNVKAQPKRGLQKSSRAPLAAHRPP